MSITYHSFKLNGIYVTSFIFRTLCWDLSSRQPPPDPAVSLPVSQDCITGAWTALSFSALPHPQLVWMREELLHKRL